MKGKKQLKTETKIVLQKVNQVEKQIDGKVG